MKCDHLSYRIVQGRTTTLLPTGAIAPYHLKIQLTCACSPKASAAAANLSVTA